MDGNAKLEAWDMFETPTRDMSTGAGPRGGGHGTSIFIYHPLGKKPGHPSR